MFQKLILALGCLALLSTGFSNTSFAQADKNVAIRLLPEKTAVKDGDTITVGIQQIIRPGWHTYWANPGDSGAVIRVKWSGARKIEAAPMQWPIPKRLPMGPLMNFGYEDEVTLLQDITIPNAGSEQTITADIELLVCDEICIPETHQASFTINGNEEPVPAAVELARTKLPIDMGWQTTMAEQDGNLVVTIATDTPNAFNKLRSIELYPEEWGLISNPEKTSAKKDEGHLVLTHKRGERDLSDAPISNLLVVYEDAAGTRKAVRVSGVTGDAVPVEKASIAQETGGFVKAILFALLGGLILNLMPCVFPVLSMKALSLVKLKDKELSKARMNGIAYTVGILACFTVIAGILLLLKAGGAQVGWGFQLQHPAIILFLAYLFFTLGLNLIGFFEINFKFVNAGQSLTQKTGMTGSFFTGVLATLVATPCTAPFMGVAMGYALTQPAYVSLLIFLALGFGLALPYLALTFSPALRHILPKPGAWMETFKQFLAFPMFASACWLLWVLSQQISHMGQLFALLGMLAIALGVWLLRKQPARKEARLAVLVLAFLTFGFVFSTFLTVQQDEAQTAEQIALEAEDNWEGFTRAKLDDYLKGNDPIFVNMTAAWCITCKVNEKVALAIDSTRNLFEQKNVRYLKGDWTNQNPEITNFLEEYGRSGVPIYVYYGPRMEGGARPEPVVLPQILTPGIVEDTINNPTGEQNQ